MRRRFLFFLAAVFAAALLLALTLPWWLGAAARGLGPRWGVRVGSYERLGYRRFAAHDVEFQRGGVRVTAARIESDTPMLWLVQQLEGDAREIAVADWRVEVMPPPSANPARAANPSASGWSPLQQKLEVIAAKLDHWLPRATLGRGVVRWHNGELAVAGATWTNRTLTVKQLEFRGRKADASVEFPASGDDLRLAARLADGAGEIALRGRGAEIDATLSWWEQHATLHGRFGAGGWLPEEATLRADDWNLPGARLKLGDAYAQVRGHAHVDWRAGNFVADIAASGEPAAGKKAPPLDVTLRGHGDLQAFTIEALHAALPGMVADLSAPVTIDRQGKVRETSAARFAVSADLAKQPWFTATGSAQGEARLVSGVAQAPVVEFQFSARDVAAQGVAIASAELNGRFEWPRVQIATATIVGADGGRLQGRGGWDFRAKEILDAEVSGEIRRATLARWLPAQPQFEAVSLHATASGPLTELVHAGEAKATAVTFRGVKPLEIEANWHGRGRAVENFSAVAAAGATKLSLAGAIDAQALKLSEMTLAQNGALRLRLTRPAELRWQPALQLDGLNLAGPEGALDASVAWGATGHAGVAVRNIASTWFADLIALPGPGWTVTSMALNGTWDRGPMKFSAVLGAAIELGDSRKATINLAGHGDKNGLRLEALRAAEGEQSIVNATGTIPLTLAPGTTPLLRIDEHAPLALDAETAPNAAFWQELSALTGLELKTPAAAAHVKGTWDRPTGELMLKAERVAADPKRFKRPLPTVEALDVALSGDGGGVQLERFSFRIEGQTVTASGRVPVGNGGWADALKAPLAAARRDADVRLEIPDADLAAFARFLPTALAPKGRLHVDVNYRGGALGGSIGLRDAATRPLGPLGVLQNIEADLRLAGRTIELRSVSAQSGGEDVRLTGRLEFPESAAPVASGGGALAGFVPKFNVALKGRNLPFVRRTGLLVRGDLDLKLESPERGAPRVSGTVKLRDSLFLQDVRALLPGGAQSKSRRPPYFAVETPPLDAWRLDLDVEGERFMQLRTTVFNGVASARFHLGGTLGEPVALGDAIVDEGRVRLPFAGFEVQEGRVTLTREQPYEPQIWLVATTRLYDYDLRMEISGPASKPVLAFSSTPPLEHGQILLMVMAGEAPKNEVTFTDQQRAQKLGTFLGQSLLSSFGDSENADRLTITSGEKISRQGRETYNVEYRLDKRWSITGEYDEFDDYNVGAKWRAYARGGRDDTRTGKTKANDEAEK
ncbi:MAG TPA: translocation/assembly module TamB domain-containing protein [Opitutaceae bacterium]|nr:translocation/assembly module TamB domain-containing protein [Opitutaceae bacterium]